MAHGKHPKNGELNPPAKDHHLKGFEEALKNALDSWSGDPDQIVSVTFGAKVTPNPGGVKEYHATINP